MHATDIQGFHNHTYSVPGHDHTQVGTTTNALGTNNYGDCDNDACSIASGGHTHDFGYWTGGPGSAASDVTWGNGDHSHTAWVDQPGWNTGGPNPNTTNSVAMNSWPPYRDMVFCQKT